MQFIHSFTIIIIFIFIFILKASLWRLLTENEPWLRHAFTHKDTEYFLMIGTWVSFWVFEVFLALYLHPRPWPKQHRRGGSSRSLSRRQWALGVYMCKPRISRRGTVCCSCCFWLSVLCAGSLRGRQCIICIRWTGWDLTTLNSPPLH